VNARSYPHGNGRSFPFPQLTYQADRLEGGFSHWFWTHHHPSLVCSAITKPFSWGNTRRILSNLKHGQDSSSPHIGPRVCLRWRNCVTARRLTGSNRCPRPFCLAYIITLVTASHPMISPNYLPTCYPGFSKRFPIKISVCILCLSILVTCPSYCILPFFSLLKTAGGL
jgi:hypothetical protein